MEIHHKSMARKECPRILNRDSVHGFFEESGLKGEMQLIHVHAVTKPLTKSYEGNGGSSCVTILDAGYYWLQIAPENAYWWLTVMYDGQLHLVEYYFDLTAGNELCGSGESGFADMFLDVVLVPGGQVYLLDEDELEEAYREGTVDEVSYQLTRQNARELMAGLEGREEQLERFCWQCLGQMLEGR